MVKIVKTLYFFLKKSYNYYKHKQEKPRKVEKDMNKNTNLVEEVSAIECGDYQEYYDEDCEECYTSSSSGDYSPSCPWNAPGMSIRDFI